MQAYLFPPTCDEDHYWQLFWQSDLGQLYQAIPWEELAALFPEKRFPQGKKPWLDKKGMIGLEMLKSYLGLSDAKLVERLNTDWAMRLFCGLCPLPVRWIRDHNLPSASAVRSLSQEVSPVGRLSEVASRVGWLLAALLTASPPGIN